MLQAPVKPSNYSLRERRKASQQTAPKIGAEEVDSEEDDPKEGDETNSHPMADMFDDSGSAEGDDDKGGRNKSRRELPPGAVATLKAWLLSPEHFSHPYPTPQDQAMLMQNTGIDKKQLKNWFTNARRRIWKPMLKKQIESGQITTTGPTGLPGSVPGLMLASMPGASVMNGTMDNPHSVQAIRVHYQQAVQQQQQQQQQEPEKTPPPAPSQQTLPPLETFSTAMFQNNTPNQFFAPRPEDQSQPQMASVSSLGTLPRQSSNVQLSKTDSHAVLMELFARDQDLVRQATESARLKAEAKQQQQPTGGHAGTQLQQQQQQQNPGQHPMRSSQGGGTTTLPNVPTMNTWPHFSSITSLNNLGTIPGVKSITSLSGADLANKGNVNKMGNLAQVKSMESMGKNDSYAFLEVFFGDRNSSSSANLSTFGGGGGSSALMKGGKQAGEEDNEIGLSLEDESPSQPMKKDLCGPGPISSSPQPMSMHGSNQDSGSNPAMESGTLKRAYDDALAARGLISVSRSCEKLTDLVLPAKMQRTLSQEYVNKDQHSQTMGYGQFSFSSNTNSSAPSSQQSLHHQYPGQQPVEPDNSTKAGDMFGASDTGGHVQVPFTTKCALCSQTNVDTQLRPCGHMFHERCLKPSLQTPRGPPKCPVDNVPMHSAVLAIPTDDTVIQQQQQHQSSWNYPSLQSLSSSIQENKRH